MKNIHRYIEAMIFANDQATSLKEIQESLVKIYGWELPQEELLEIINDLKEKYQGEDFAFEIVEIAGGFQFMSKAEYHELIAQFLNIKSNKKLSSAALETLSIIAYKQPIVKSEIEQIRGVNCDYTVQKLLEKELISIKGRADGPGKPLLYGISPQFMDYFGINSPKDLPKLKEIEQTEENEIGNRAEIEESDNSEKTTQ
ncbi:MAG: SMC-Scp complex subunit ScpB [Chitinophagales bacterium]